MVNVVRVASVEEEDARRLNLERHRLVTERVSHVNRIKGLLATQGIYDYDLFGVTGVSAWPGLSAAMAVPCRRDWAPRSGESSPVSNWCSP